MVRLLLQDRWDREAFSNASISWVSNLITQAVITLLFALVGIAVIAWIISLLPELRLYLKENMKLGHWFEMIFNAAPVQQDATKASAPVKVVIKDILPLLFWLLILLPMFLFPIILVVFPLMHIPWSYLLPPTG